MLLSHFISVDIIHPSLSAIWLERRSRFAGQETCDQAKAKSVSGIRCSWEATSRHIRPCAPLPLLKLQWPRLGPRWQVFLFSRQIL